MLKTLNGCLLMLVAVLLFVPLGAQEPAPKGAPASTPEDDAISAQAAQMEADLAKVSDSSPEAADLLAKLSKLYYDNGRVFGLIRSTQLFATNHPAHPQHRDMMLLLLDGLLATSRNKDLAGACRQYLSRYTEDAAVPRVELLLAQTLDQLDDWPNAAVAHEAVWKRQPQTVAGRMSGVRATQLYTSFNNGQAYRQAATLAEQMLDAYPKSELALQLGMQALYNWERAADYAKFNLLANKMAQLGLPADPVGQRELQARIANNYSRMGQYANSVEAYKRARALGDRIDLHRTLIMQMYNANAKGADLEPVVNEYFQKYPEAKDRFYLRSYLAHSYLRDNDKARGLALLRELLPYDAATLGNASAFVRENSVDPAKVADTEAALKDAIAKNKENGFSLRYSLAFEVYRDRMKDDAKFRQTLRELISTSPSNDGNTQAAVSTLLYGATTDAEFLSDVALILKARKDWAHWAAHRAFLGNWIQEARQNKDHKARADLAKAQYDTALQDAYVLEWVATENPAGWAPQNVARAKLADPARNLTLTDEQAWSLYYNLGYYYRHYGSAPQRVEAATWFGRLAARFPKNMEAANYYLQTATDYAPPEVQKEATLHMLKQDPEINDGDAWYRMMRAADANKDAALVKSIYDWMMKTQTRLGVETYYSYVIGDTLEKYGLSAEALAYWQRSFDLNLNESEVRNVLPRLIAKLKPEDTAGAVAILQKAYALPGGYHGYYAMLLADKALAAKDYAGFEKILLASRDRQYTRALGTWGIEEYPPQSWVDAIRASKEITDADKRRLFTVIRDLEIGRPSAAAALALLELPDEKPVPAMVRILAHQKPTTMVWNDATDWDRMFVYAQAAMARSDYSAASTILTGMLSNITNVDVGRRKSGQDMVGQAYARMGGTGLAIDENSPIAPLMQAALYLRLGDERLALETYNANKALFDQHRDEIPVDLILFACETHIAAGGDENFDRAEDILRNWLVKNSEAMGLDDSTKAKVQLLLAKNYYKAQRYDVARSEYTTVINRYPKSSEAVEAEFGIGETFMAQKVYDQAESTFEKLAGSRDREVVVRAEFLRGVLANRRGDREEAREIFRGVLDRVPNVELANQTLYNLAEVYGAEQRYMDALELLRTVGRLGQKSKRTHAPGLPLSIVVQDSDLGTSQGRSKIPVRVTTEPGGDEELVDLLSSQGSKGLFRIDLPTQLGKAVKGDRTLQVTGNDVIKCDYPETFKLDFKNVPLSDAEIKIASDGKFAASSSRIVDEAKKSFSAILEEEESENEADRRVSQNRPKDQLKPGNPIYMQVQDADRDLTDQADTVAIKLQAASGDTVTVLLTETGPHTGIFEGTSTTAELPAGALASDTAIEHSPLMAIDQSPDTFWLSEPDGATPKSLSVDMKDLHVVSHVALTTPDPTKQAPVRGMLQGSNDGRFWFRIAQNPTPPPAPAIAGEFGPMTARLYAGNHTGFTTWTEVVNLTKNGKPLSEEAVEKIGWKLDADHEDAKKPHTAVWHGKLVQPRASAARFKLQGQKTALMINGVIELDLGAGDREVDVWLERGLHDVVIFSATTDPVQGIGSIWTRADHNTDQVVLAPFRKVDFDIDAANIKSTPPREPAVVAVADNVWSFKFEPIELRHVRFVIQEYLGEAVAISNVEIGGEEAGEFYIPTKADILSLASNDTLEISGGDVVTATYIDDYTQNSAGRSQLLTSRLTATYFNATTTPINYDFDRLPGGQVINIRKELMRIDPGDRFIVEITDYDLDTSNVPDALKFKVQVNDGEPIELTATETDEYSGIFTKEVDTSATPSGDKLVVKSGDRIYCSYLDAQNTFPGHSVPREAVVYVNQPSEGSVRILETRIIRPPAESKQPPQIIFKNPQPGQAVSKVALEAPITVEVYDRDAAKDSRSSVTVQLTTTDGAKIDVACVVSSQFSDYEANTLQSRNIALEEGRFIGQVILQLGGKDSPDVVPLSAGMPRNLVGGAIIADAPARTTGEALVTRVLNLTGKDIATATYQDKLRPKKAPAADRLAQARLIANGTLACTDRDYEHEMKSLHVGEKLFLVVTDADLDISDERDFASIEISSEFGEKESLQLEETSVHSGIFTGSIVLKSVEKPTPDNLKEDALFIESYFGDTIRVKYLDKSASTESGELEALVEVPVVIGTDGLVQAFSKTFNDENLAVETKFHIAESYFELFKSHRKLARDDEQRSDLESGKRVLREVMEDYPNPKYVPRIQYLIGQFAQELQGWPEAIDAYLVIVRQYPESTLAPDAQYKLAQCYEESERFDEALEAYVTLAATYPKSPLIANVMIRISDHFYKSKNYEVAAQVGEKFLERFDGHEWASRMAFRVGQCYYKGKQYPKAGEAFDKFAKVFPDDALCADAMFWAGESFRMGNNNPQAFRRYNKCRWEHPASDAAKYARGRLALPEMLAQFESEANSVEDE